jgi:glycerate kinase
VKILIAPDKFKGSISAQKVARILADEINSILPAALVTQIPLADGGDGSLEVICSYGYKIQSVTAPNAVGKMSKCDYGISSDGKSAFIELAQVCGIAALSIEERSPWLTSTKGLGVVIRDAIKHGITSISLSIGGSASIDGGSGLLEGLGARLIDKDGHELAGNLANLFKVASIDYTEVDQLLSKVKLKILTDVTNPLIGDNGAAAIYGSQKGLSLSDVPIVDSALTYWASILLPKNFNSLMSEPGLGSAGGVALPLYARYSIPIISGSDYFFEQFKIDSLIAESDLVITGEGSLDNQSFMGKIVGKVLACASSQGKPSYAIAGIVSEIDDNSISTISLSELAGSRDNSMRDPERYLREAAVKILANYRNV